MSLSSVIAAHKLTIGLVALGTIALGGTTAAAYADALPSGLQDEAHALIGAPTADPTTDPTAPPTAEPTDSATDTATPTPEPTTDPTSTAVPVGPDATGPAAHGLCTAYEHGGLAATSVAYASLEKAAGGAGAIDAYCATIVAPGNSGAHQPAPAPTGAPAGTDGAAAHGNSQNAHGSSHAGGGHGRP